MSNFLDASDSTGTSELPTMNHPFYLVQRFLIFIGIGLNTVFANAQVVDPKDKWLSIDTQYARFSFVSEHQKLALDYIQKFEAMAPLAIDLFGEPPRKGEFLIQDVTDRANGSAQVVPRPTVRLFPALPLPTSTIGEYSDSAYELIFHEFTHVLNMEPSHGYAAGLRFLFGSIARPNQVLPKWYTEGLAVFTESYFSPGGGRLSSQHLSGLTRALTLSKSWDQHKISNINYAKPDWLGGSRFYLFGGLLWETLVAEKGLSSIRKLNQSYSKRLPLFLDGPLNRLFPGESMTWEKLWEKTKKRWKEKTLRQIKTLQAQPILKGRPLPQKGYNNFDPSISPNGKWLTYISHSKRNGSGAIKLVRRHPKKGFRAYKPITVVNPEHPQRVTWHPRSHSFLFQSHSPQGRFKRRFHLKSYHLKSKKIETIVSDRSAIEACYSPSGQQVFYVSHKGGQKSIFRHELKKKDAPATEVYSGKIGENVSSLICDSDENLLFIAHPVGKARRVVRLSATTQSRQEFLKEYDPFFLSKNKNGYLLSSAQSGVQNVYVSSRLEGPYRGATNTLTRTTSAALDPIDSTLYFTQYTSKGPRLFFLRAPQWESLADTPPKTTPLFQMKGVPRATGTTQSLSREVSSTETTSGINRANESSKPAEKGEANKIVEDSTERKVRPYSSWSHILPNHWLPNLFLVDRGAIFQAQTSAGDPLGKNAITLFGQWDTLTTQPGFSVGYRNASYPMTFGVNFSDFHTFFYPTETSLRSTRASAWTGFPLPWLSSVRGQIRWSFNQLQRTTGAFFVRQGPRLSLSYSRTQAQSWAISREKGWNINLAYQQFLPEISNTPYREATLSLGTYWSSFMPGRSVFYLGLNGSFVPESDRLPSVFGVTTLSGPFINPQQISSAFLQRGYLSGSIVAQQIANINAEIRFPIADIFWGFRSPPGFLRRIYGSFVYDASIFRGFHNIGGTSESTNFDEWIHGGGFELNSDVGVFFQLPLTLTFGLYHGLNKERQTGLIPFFTIRL